MSPPRKAAGGPDAAIRTAEPNTHRAAELDGPESSPLCPRCGFGEVCVCDFYRNWTVEWPTQPYEPVSVQLRRRRAAAHRSPRLAGSCRRDPISGSVW